MISFCFYVFHFSEKFGTKNLDLLILHIISFSFLVEAMNCIQKNLFIKKKKKTQQH